VDFGRIISVGGFPRTVPLNVKAAW